MEAAVRSDMTPLVITEHQTRNDSRDGLHQVWIANIPFGSPELSINVSRSAEND
jgi:hypothetical protein